MNNITISCNPYSITAVSNMFIDNYMVQASGEYVKVYLYLLRSTTSEDYKCSLDAMAEHFEHTENDIMRALRYWEKMGLVQLECNPSNEIVQIALVDPTAGACNTQLVNSMPKVKTFHTPELTTAMGTVLQKVTATPEETVASTPLHNEANESVTLSTTSNQATNASNTLDDLVEDEDLSEIFFTTENYIGTPLSSNDMDTILFWYNSLSLSADIIQYLIEYSLDRGIKSIKYMDKIAQTWASVDIHTLEAAKDYVKAHSKTNRAVMNAFGITGRKLVKLETDMVDKWLQNYNFSLDLIIEACNRTIQKTGQGTFSYADSILANWHKNNVHTIDDVAALDQNFHQNNNANAKTNKNPANRFSDIAQRTYNYNEMEQQLYNRKRSTN